MQAPLAFLKLNPISNHRYLMQIGVPCHTSIPLERIVQEVLRPLVATSWVQTRLYSIVWCRVPGGSFYHPDQILGET